MKKLFKEAGLSTLPFAVYAVYFAFVYILFAFVFNAVVYAQVADTTLKAVHWSFAQIDWGMIGKYIGIIIGSGFSLNVVIGLILHLIPNPLLFNLCEKWGILLTKLFRQKFSEENVDTFETSLITALKGLESGIKKANPDVPDK